MAQLPAFSAPTHCSLIHSAPKSEGASAPSSRLGAVDTRTTPRARRWRSDLNCEQQALEIDRRRLEATAAAAENLKADQKRHRERLLLMLVVEAARYQRRFFDPSGFPNNRLYAAWNAAVRPRDDPSLLPDGESNSDAPYSPEATGLPAGGREGSMPMIPTCRSFMMLTDDAVAMLLADVRMMLSAQSMIRSTRDDFMFDSVTQQLFNLRLFSSSAFHSYFVYRPGPAPQ